MRRAQLNRFLNELNRIRSLNQALHLIETTPYFGAVISHKSVPSGRT